jgi:DNA-binding XRE family transcriptional regulator
MRVRQGLTQQELACAVGVLEKDIKLLERNVPATLDFRRKVFKTLWGKMAIRERI